MKDIMVVDDEPAIGRLLKVALESRGFRVHVETTAEKALTILEQSSASVDLLITDVRMPGMDGLELAELAVAAKPRLPVMFISGHADASELRKRMTARSCFVDKPFNVGVLAGRVLEILADNPC